MVAATVVHARTSVARRPGAHPHRRKTQRFEWSREPDIHMDECAWIDGGCTRRNPSATGNPYRKRHRARRSADAHRRKSQWRASFRRPDIHTGMRRRLARNLASKGDTDGASRGFIGRAAASSRAARRSRVQIHRWVTRCVESREQAKTHRNLHVANHAPALTVRMHSPSIGAGAGCIRPRARMRQSRARDSRLECAARRTAANGAKPAPVQAPRVIGRDTHHRISQHFASSCRELSTTCVIYRAASGHPHL